MVLFALVEWDISSREDRIMLLCWLICAVVVQLLESLLLLLVRRVPWLEGRAQLERLLDRRLDRLVEEEEELNDKRLLMLLLPHRLEMY